MEDQSAIRRREILLEAQLGQETGHYSKIMVWEVERMKEVEEKERKSQNKKIHPEGVSPR